MRQHRQLLVYSLAIALFGSAGCELIASVDRTKIDGQSTGGGGATTSTTTSSTTSTTSTSGGGGTGGMTTTSSTGGGGTGGMTTTSSTGGGGTGGMTTTSTTSGTGGMGTGGGTTCTQVADCPTPPNECQTATCDAGQCGVSFVQAGTALGAASQTAGDCHTKQCDGNGGIVDTIDDTDKPNDGKDCTNDVCTNGVPSNTNKQAGTSCGTNLVCDGNGACVGCITAADCGAATSCKSFTCNAGTCVQNNVASGTVVSNTTVGDCKSDQCDGNGNILVNANDANDKPVDNKQCTDDVCTGGTPSNPNKQAGAPCTENGGTKCDGNGSCVQCTTASECGTDTACKTFACNAGVCQQNNVASGTVVGNPMPGDCRTDQCDGSGNITANAIDNTDKPADDGNPCTLEVCNSGTPGHPNAPQGTSCNQNGGSICNGSGQCVTCVNDSDCPTGGACQTPKCSAGVCGFVAAPAGDLPPALQTPQDCQKLVCNGTSQTPVNVPDDTDVHDDGNQCTSDSCNGGMMVHTPVSSGTSCNQNNGTKCDSNGNCVQCFNVSDCPAGANECVAAACSTAGQCSLQNVTAGTPTVAQTAGDCKQQQCNGNGGFTSVADDSDLPNDGSDCTTDTCNAGTPVFTPKAVGTSCNTNGGTACNAAGVCVVQPTVTGTTPSDGGTAGANTTIAVTFSQAMNPATLTAQTSVGACTGSIQVSVNDFATCVGFFSAAPAMSGSNTVATLIPAPGLLINRSYKIRVTTAATNASNIPLFGTYTSTNGFATTNPLSSASSGVVISQIYGGGGNTGAYYKNDFVELHNRGATAVDLTGWSVQTASANGSTWTVTNLSGSIPAGGYYLVWESAGTSTTAVALPTADASGTSTMGAGSGQVALLNTTTKLTVACPTGASVIDFVAYGGTTSCTGATVTPAPSNTTSVVRNVSGCIDTNDSAKDFTAGTINATGPNIPRNSASPRFQCTPAQNESGNALEADYCNTQSPLSITAAAGSMVTVYGRIYEAGVTVQSQPNPPPGVTAQVGYGSASVNPEYEAGWTWIDASYNASCSGCGVDDDEFQATFALPAAGTYRFSLDGGSSWTYCDNNQASDFGAGSNGANTTSLAFNFEDEAVLVSQ